MTAWIRHRVLLRSHRGLLVIASGLMLCTSPAAAEEKSPGKALYQKLCAECHGDRGQGVAGTYDETLYGDRSLADLTKIIVETMPEEEPGACVAAEAQAVAEYMYRTFYTAEARSKHQPARVEMARLTVPQYENVIADLVGSFIGNPQVDDRRGLSAEYFKSRRPSRDKRVFERIDPQVNFDFGESTPDPEKIEPEEFSMKWEGSVIAAESGDYEFRIKTQNGARLWVNDMEDALIDAWVSSGPEVREETATLHLIGGRAYPLKLDFFTFKEETASIALEWRPPHKVWETIPERSLNPQRTKPTVLVSTPFPPDDASVGYERGTSISKAWDSATTFAAIDVVNQITGHLDQLAPGNKQTPRADRLREFCRQFAERAFRRPLTDEQREIYIDAQFTNAEDPDAGAKRSLLLILKSPRFLYGELHDGHVDDFDIASRLALSLWGSLPDEALARAAAEGRLHTAEQVRQHARRMVDNPRTRTKLRGFFLHLLQLKETSDLAKDPEAFPGFDDSLVADLRTSLELFVDDVVWTDTSDYRDLLLSSDLFLNARLAEFYQVDLAMGDAFQKVSFSPKERSGIVTHPFLMSALAYHSSSSPIHRGVFVTRRLLSRALKPPPMAIEFKDSRFDPGLTMREKVAEMTKPAACQTCHSVINPLGFSLEQYDAVGRFRTEEKDKPIDTASEYRTLDGRSVELNGARDLAEFAAQSELAQLGFIEHLVNHLVKQPARAYGDQMLSEVREQFEANGFHIQKLMVDIVVRAALHDSQQTSQE